MRQTRKCSAHVERWQKGGNGRGWILWKLWGVADMFVAEPRTHRNKFFFKALLFAKPSSTPPPPRAFPFLRGIHALRELFLDIYFFGTSRRVLSSTLCISYRNFWNKEQNFLFIHSKFE